MQYTQCYLEILIRRRKKGFSVYYWNRSSCVNWVQQQDKHTVHYRWLQKFFKHICIKLLSGICPVVQMHASIQTFFLTQKTNWDNYINYRLRENYIWHLRLINELLIKLNKQLTSGSSITLEYLIPFLSFLHFSQLYILSPFNSSAEKKAAKQSCKLIDGPQNQLKIRDRIKKGKANDRK